jgi:arabinogalactan endo-1,4-beta-galactosidase
MKITMLTGLVCLGAMAPTARASTNACTFQVDMSVQTALGNFRSATDKVAVSGSWNNWVTTNYLTARTDNTNIYTLTCLLTNGTFPNYKFIINSNSAGTIIWETYWGVSSSNNRFFGMPASGGTNLPVVCFNDQTNAAPGFPFVVAADFSHLKFFEDRGISYKEGGLSKDALAILKSKGITAVRLRLFTGTDAQVRTNVAYNYTNNLTYNLPLAARVKQAGLQFILDFHYSDTWADAGHQAVPITWTNGLTYATLLTKMRSYTSNCIAAFQATNAMPDYVQIGNEITQGMLWSYGRVGGTTNFNQLAALITAAVQGISDVAGTNMPKIIIHIDRGGDWATTQWFFDNLRNYSVPCDIIGESYYPFWHGSWTNSLPTCLTNTIKRYDKPVMLMETAFPWNTGYWTTNIYGIPPGTNGQVQYLTALARVITNTPGGMGAGIAWWGAEYQAVSGVNEAGFNTASFFDAGGNVLPVADAFGNMAPSPVFTNLAPNPSTIAGATNLTLSGTLRMFWATNVVTGPTYPSNGESISVTINGNTQTGAVTNATGSFSVNYNPSTIPSSPNSYAITYAYAGGAQLNAATDTSTTLTVTTSGGVLTVTLTGIVSKAYDGTNAATLAPDNYILSGVLNGDTVVLNNPSTGTYDSRNVGTGKTVTVTGLAISGADAGQYTLASDSVSETNGIITSATLAVTNLTVADKVYDGTTNATLNANSAALSGVVSGDDVSLVTGTATAFFADAAAGTNKPVTVTGCNLAGADTGNYVLVQPDGLTATILSLAVPVISGLTPLAGQTDSVQLSFSGQPGQGYRLLGAASLTLPLAQWTVLTHGIFGTNAVTLTLATTNFPQRFFQVASP